MFAAPWPGFCPGLEALGCGSPAEGALQMAASMHACKWCRALGSAGVESAE